MREKRSNLEFIQQSAEELYNSETSHQIRADVKSMRIRYQHLADTIGDRINRLERMIADLKIYQEELLNTSNKLKNIETNLQIEHHTTASPFGSSYGRTLEEQLNNLKQVKFDIESLSTNINKLNEKSKKYLYASSNVEPKFSSKMRADINEINDKLDKLRADCSAKHYVLKVRIHYVHFKIFIND